MPTTDLKHIAGQIAGLIAGEWAMYEPRFTASLALLERLDIGAHMAAWEAKRARMDAGGGSGAADVTADEGLAVIRLQGALTKQGPMSMEDVFDGTSTIRARRAIRQAANDPSVTGIQLVIDSPGGTVDGTADLADDIAAATERKPVHAYVDGLCASAAYWAASQTAHITAGRTSLVGSIGTYAVIEDLSGMAEAMGVKVHVVKAGEFKGNGVPGAPVSDAYLAHMQGIVNDLNAHFTAAVGKGRAMDAEAVKGLADGRVHVAKDAKRMGLIDAVGDEAAALQTLRKSARRGRTGAARAAGEKHMTLTEFKQMFGQMLGFSADAADTAPVTTAEATEPTAAPAAAAPATTGVLVDASELETLKAKAAKADEAEALKAQMAEEQAKAHADAIEAEAAGLVKAGKITPAMKAHALTMLGNEATADAFRALVAASPAAVAFGEKGADSTDSIAFGDLDEFLAAEPNDRVAAVKQYQAANKIATFAEADTALRAALKENVHA